MDDLTMKLSDISTSTEASYNHIAVIKHMQKCDNTLVKMSKIKYNTYVYKIRWANITLSRYSSKELIA